MMFSDNTIRHNLIDLNQLPSELPVHSFFSYQPSTMESEVNKWDPPNPFETSQALKGGDVTHKNEKGYLEDISKKKLFKVEISI